jgi:hypothetical protein
VVGTKVLLAGNNNTKACRRTACTCGGPVGTAGDPKAFLFQHWAPIAEGRPERRDEHLGKFFQEEREVEPVRLCVRRAKPRCSPAL